GMIHNTHRKLGDILQWILLAFDLDYRGKEKVQLYQIFTDFLIEQYALGRRSVLIIDEAQNLDADTLEELRMLSNVNASKDLVLQIILVGQPELVDTLSRPDLRQFAQRIAISYQLAALTLEETHGYIRHRIRVAGGQPELFSDQACDAVFLFSKGIPRLINGLCDLALVYAFGEEKQKIDLDILLAVGDDRSRFGLNPSPALQDEADLRAEIDRLGAQRAEKLAKAARDHATSEGEPETAPKRPGVPASPLPPQSSGSSEQGKVAGNQVVAEPIPDAETRPLGEANGPTAKRDAPAKGAFGSPRESGSVLSGEPPVKDRQDPLAADPAPEAGDLTADHLTVGPSEKDSEPSSRASKDSAASRRSADEPGSDGLGSLLASKGRAMPSTDKAPDDGMPVERLRTDEARIDDVRTDEARTDRVPQESWTTVDEVIAAFSREAEQPTESGPFNGGDSADSTSVARTGDRRLLSSDASESGRDYGGQATDAVHADAMHPNEASTVLPSGSDHETAKENQRPTGRVSVLQPDYSDRTEGMGGDAAPKESGRAWPFVVLLIALIVVGWMLVNKDEGLELLSAFDASPSGEVVEPQADGSDGSHAGQSSEERTSTADLDGSSVDRQTDENGDARSIAEIGQGSAVAAAPAEGSARENSGATSGVDEDTAIDSGDSDSVSLLQVEAAEGEAQPQEQGTLAEAAVLAASQLEGAGPEAAGPEAAGPEGAGSEVIDGFATLEVPEAPPEEDRQRRNEGGETAVVNGNAGADQDQLGQDQSAGLGSVEEPNGTENSTIVGDQLAAVDPAAGPGEDGQNGFGAVNRRIRLPQRKPGLETLSDADRPGEDGTVGTAVADGGTSFAVQLATAGSEESALRATNDLQTQLQILLAGRPLFVEKIRQDGAAGAVDRYRILSERFSTRSAAVAMCDGVIASGFDCEVVSR
ncbi:MAG: AAA family ATPase, partial [Pseudomonadota bacterium]